MAYNEFSLNAVKQQFGLQTLERAGLFASVAPIPIESSAPSFDTAAANAGVDTPAMGAWIKGTVRLSGSMKSIMSFSRRETGSRRRFPSRGVNHH